MNIRGNAFFMGTPGFIFNAKNAKFFKNKRIQEGGRFCDGNKKTLQGLFFFCENPILVDGKFVSNTKLGSRLQ